MATMNEKDYEAWENGLIACEWDGCDDNDDYDGGAVM